MSNGKPSLIFIMGMHRSGTSALAHLTQEMGANLGAELIAASFDNPEGFFEHARLVAFNNQIFETLGLHWDATVLLPAEWQKNEKIQAIQQQIITWLQTEFANAQTIVLKDPRLCRLLPIWLEAAQQLGWNANAIHIFRDISEIAHSFAVRENTDHRKAVILSVLYLVEAERATRSIPRVMLTYDQLFGDIKNVLNTLYRLPVQWKYSLEEALPRLSSIIKPKLRHQQKPDLSPFLDKNLLTLSEHLNPLLLHPEKIEDAASAVALNNIYQQITTAIAASQQWFGFWHDEAMKAHSMAVDLHQRNLEVREQHSILDNYMLHAKQLEQLVSDLQKQNTQIENEKTQIQNKNILLSEELAHTQKELSDILNSKGWKTLEKMRVLKKWIHL